MIKKLPWDTKFFGYNIGSYTSDFPKPEEISGLEKEFNDSGLDCIYVFCDTKKSDCEKLWSDRNNFKEVDGHVKYELLKKDWEDKGENHISVPGEIAILDKNSKNKALYEEELKDLSSETALVSRFYIDPNFRPKAKEMYSIWINNIIKSEKGIIATNVIESEVAGMVASEIKDDVGVIELVKVKNGHEGKGIAGKLVAESIRQLFNAGAEKISVVTQINNVPARKLYEKNGFVLKKESKIYHWWKK